MTTSRMSRLGTQGPAAASLIVALFAAASVAGSGLSASLSQTPAADPNVVVNPVM